MKQGLIVSCANIPKLCLCIFVLCGFHVRWPSVSLVSSCFGHSHGKELGSIQNVCRDCSRTSGAVHIRNPPTVMAVTSLTISGTQRVFDCLFSLQDLKVHSYLTQLFFCTLMAKDSGENAHQQRARSCANLHKAQCQTEKLV